MSNIQVNKIFSCFIIDAPIGKHIFGLSMVSRGSCHGITTDPDFCKVTRERVDIIHC